MEHTERLAIVRLAATYHDTLGRVQTATQLDAVLRLGRELSTTLPADQAELFARLCRARDAATRGAAGRIPHPRKPSN
ncbi:hypothetical protein [Cryptosporangium arvum]|jgi:hypothetical protein|uniref:Uncharacterized protein n=1 Tax=Cryptosporangium arvum DSM 44712 TaxID=927661 RepID=A0A010YM47_9ACTN|nr:hypothetical protein [Cryptosporangium arvum]EXG81260.1 hypothetical protein CryarDRAFT_2369 [Cryptosporangium arvum DSM 44712]